MNIVEPSVEEITIQDPFKRIELAGRICYKSTEKITDGSSRPFVDTLVRMHHYTPLEHAMVDLPLSNFGELGYLLTSASHDPKYPRNRVVIQGVDNRVICNVRTLVETRCNLDALTGPDVRIADNFVTLVIVTDRGIANELIRHRAESYDDNGYFEGWKSSQESVDEVGLCQQSTRYVDFNKKGFSVVRPVPFAFAYDETSEEYKIWHASCEASYAAYTRLRALAVKPQAARNVLPLSTSTVVVMSGMVDQWMNLLRLRLPEDASPQARYVAALIWNIVKKYLTEQSAGYYELKTLAKYADDIFEQAEMCRKTNTKE